MARAENSKSAGSNINGVVEGLGVFLADTYLLMGKTQAFHWNVTGSNFKGLHELFEEQYNDLFKAVDVLAERIRALDAPAPWSIAEMSGHARISEASGPVDSKRMVQILAEDNATMSRNANALASTAEEMGDIATQDMLSERIEAHDKAAWMLRAHLG